MSNTARERIKDLVAAALLAIVAIGGFLFINPKGAAVTEGPGGLSWRSLPFMYSGLLLALTLVFAITSARGLVAALREGPDPVATEVDPDDVDGHAEWLTNARRLAVVACILAYAIALPLFGFILTTPLLLFVMFYIFGRTSFVANLVTALLGGAALSVLFVGALKLPLQGAVWDPATRALNDAMRAMGL